jgi:hypothetical protein
MQIEASDIEYDRLADLEIIPEVKWTIEFIYLSRS